MDTYFLELTYSEIDTLVGFLGEKLAEYPNEDLQAIYDELTREED